VPRAPAVVNFFDRRKNPLDVQGLTLYLGQIITLYLGLCCITNIVQHSDFGEFSRMLASHLKECKGCESGNPLAGVFLLREERYTRVICLIQKRRLLARGARVRPLRPFPTAHPVMCTFFLHACFAMMCVVHQPLGFWRHHHSCVFCVHDLHHPLSYGC